MSKWINFFQDAAGISFDRMAQIKRHQLLFLLVTSERIYGIKWFFAHTHYLKQQNLSSETMLF